VANTVVLLWFSAAALGSAPGGGVGRVGAVPAASLAAKEVANRSRALADLNDFGVARGLSFAPVSQARPRGLAANDAPLVDGLEAELEQARTALSALEEENANARLHKVEAELLAHPHLPQASFLLGECFELQAQAARPHDPARAAELDALRLALEGPRAPAFGEPARDELAPRPVTLEVRGLAARDELELDGAQLAPSTARVSLTPGLHQARVWRGDRPIFASFTRITSEQRLLALAVPPLLPCSSEDLAQVPRITTAPGTPLPAGIACQRWAQVRDEGDGIQVALCSGSQCGAWLRWQRQQPAPFTPIAVERRRFPAWASFVIAGGAALVTSSIVLWQSGAFERGKPAAARWEYDGFNQQALRF
jgi:hypothetical protein